MELKKKVHVITCSVYSFASFFAFTSQSSVIYSDAEVLRRSHHLRICKKSATSRWFRDFHFPQANLWLLRNRFIYCAAISHNNLWRLCRGWRAESVLASGRTFKRRQVAPAQVMTFMDVCRRWRILVGIFFFSPSRRLRFGPLGNWFHLDNLPHDTDTAIWGRLRSLQRWSG